MKFNERGGFDGLDENGKLHAAAQYGDEYADGDGYEGSDLFDDDDVEEEVVVTMNLEDEDGLNLEDVAEDLLETVPFSAISAIRQTVPPAPTAAAASTKPAQMSEAGAASGSVEKAAKKTPAKTKTAKKPVAPAKTAKKSVSK